MFFLLFLILISPFTAVAEQVPAESPANHLNRIALDSNLAHSPMWHRLLYYQKPIVGSPVSFWDSDGLFLDTSGSEDPVAELKATITGFYSPIAEYEDDNDHPLCRYPARRSWLEKSLPLHKFALPMPQCSNLKNFLLNSEREQLSLVFSSYFINNPGSMFGHTLFKLHKNRKGELPSIHSDVAINFLAAIPRDVGMLTYSVKGLLGGFDGIFQMMPYYIKIQEYNNHEARDIWEYRLDLNADEIRMMLYSLWEVGGARANYYFLTENCAYVMLMLLEVAKPEIDLMDKLHYSVIPIDIVRVVKEVGLIQEVSFEPSSYNRYEQRLDLISESGKPLVDNLLRVKRKDEMEQVLSRRSSQESALIIDAALELIEYKERLAIDKKPKTYAAQHDSLLAYRSSLRTPSAALTKVPENRPDHGHKTNMVSLGFKGIGQDRSPDLSLRWRPAMHDQLASSQGYNRDMSLIVLDHQILYSPVYNRLFLDRLEILGIRSTPAFTSLKPELSWQTHIRLEQLGQVQEGEDRLALEFAAGGGVTMAALQGKAKLSLMPLMKGGVFRQRSLGGYVKSGIDLTGYLELGAQLRMLIAAIPEYSFLDKEWSQLGQGAISYNFSQQQELRLFMQRSQQTSGLIGISLLQYY